MDCESRRNPFRVQHEADVGVNPGKRPRDDSAQHNQGAGSSTDPLVRNGRSDSPPDEERAEQRAPSPAASKPKRNQAKKQATEKKPRAPPRSNAVTDFFDDKHHVYYNNDESKNKENPVMKPVDDDLNKTLADAATGAGKWLKADSAEQTWKIASAELNHQIFGPANQWYNSEAATAYYERRAKFMERNKKSIPGINASDPEKYRKTSLKNMERWRDEYLLNLKSKLVGQEELATKVRESNGYMAKEYREAYNQHTKAKEDLEGILRGEFETKFVPTIES